MGRIDKLKSFFEYGTLTKIGAKKYTERDGVCSLPYSISNIGISAFEGNKKVKKVLGYGVKHVKESAFKDCENLESIEFEQVNTIEKLGFANTGLKEVCLPNINKIDGGAFKDCVNLRKINLGDKLNFIEKVIFEGCNELEEIIVPSKELCEKINEKVDFFLSEEQKSKVKIKFNYCGELYTLDEYNENVINLSKNSVECFMKKEGCCELPKYVTSIKDEAFKGNSKVYVVEGKLVKSVGKSAFEGCKNLQRVEFERVERIDDFAFAKTTRLNEVKFDGYFLKSIGKKAFSGCKFLKKVILKGVNKVGLKAFENCTSLEEVEICFNSKISLGKEVFTGCVNLRTITTSKESYNYVRTCVKKCFEDSHEVKVKIFDEGRFYDSKKKLEEYKESVRILTLKNKHFFGDSKRFGQKYSLSNHVEEISSEVFNGDKFVKEIEGKGVKKIDSNAFAGCINLEYTSFSSLEEVGDSAFSGCECLWSFQEFSVKSIGNNVFENCSALKYAQFCNLEKIGDEAFKNSGLFEIKIFSTIKELGKNIFKGCNNLSIIEVLNYEEYKKIRKCIKESLPDDDDIRFFDECGKEFKDMENNSFFNKNLKIKCECLNTAIKLIEEINKYNI